MMKSDSLPPSFSAKSTFVVVALVTVLTAIIVSLAPPERTLGGGIRVVYVHVGLIWTGMLSLLLAGGVALGVLATGRERWACWMRPLANLGLAFIAASLIVSLAASAINWGGIAWREPRMNAMLQYVAFGVILQVVGSWWGRPRLQAVLVLVLVGALLYLVQVTPSELHPDDAIGTSSATGIRLTFYLLFALFAGTAGWLTLAYRKQAPCRATAD